MGFIDDLLYPDDQVRAVGRGLNTIVISLPITVGHDSNFNDWAPNLYHFLNLKQFKKINNDRLITIRITIAHCDCISATN